MRLRNVPGSRELIAISPDVVHDERAMKGKWKAFFAERRKNSEGDRDIRDNFDTDHVGGLLTVMEELKVENVVISRQGEDSENFRKFREIVEKKKIKVKSSKTKRSMKKATN